jgi:hypothetical protein
MGDLSARLKKIEETEETERRDLTIYVVYDKTVRDSSGQVYSVPGERLPDSEYDFSPWSEIMPDGTRFRTGWPKNDC